MERRELLEERTVEELRQMAREKNLSGYSNLRRAELMDMIEANYARSEIKSWPESGFTRMTEEARAKIIVVGCGGAGGNTVTRITEAGIGVTETEPEADILWGARISDELKDAIRVMIMIPDVVTPWSRSPIIAQREEVKEKLDSKIK